MIILVPSPNLDFLLNNAIRYYQKFNIY